MLVKGHSDDLNNASIPSKSPLTRVFQQLSARGQLLRGQRRSKEKYQQHTNMLQGLCVLSIHTSEIYMYMRIFTYPTKHCYCKNDSMYESPYAEEVRLAP